MSNPFAEAVAFIESHELEVNCELAEYLKREAERFVGSSAGFQNPFHRITASKPPDGREYERRLNLSLMQLAEAFDRRL